MNPTFSPNGWMRHVAAASIVLLAGVAPLAAQNFATPVNPTFKVDLVPQRDAPLVAESFSFTQADAKGSAFATDVDKDGLPEAVDLDFDDLTSEENFPWTHFTFGVPRGSKLEVGSYPNASRSHIFDDLGNKVDFGFNHSGCTTVGDFTITRLEIESLDSSVGSIAIWQHHVIALDLTANLTCNDPSNPVVRVTLSYADTAKGTGTPGGTPGGGGTPTPQPPPPPPNVSVNLPLSVLEQPVVLGSDGSSSFEISTSTLPTFAGDVHLSIIGNGVEGTGLDLLVDPAHIAAPGTGTATVHIKAGPNTFPRDYWVNVMATTADGRVYASPTIHVWVICDPPMILGTDQPRGITVDRGARGSVAVKATGSAPFSYQWYRGHRGSTRFPVAGATAATFADAPAGSYWARVSNACGSADSSTVVVNER